MNDDINHNCEAYANIATIIALDFDGVLHPASCGPSHHHIANGSLRYRNHKLLEHMDIFCELIQKHSDTRIVLSTSWRLHIKHGELISFFPLPVRNAIIGFTPVDNSGNRRREIGSVLNFMQMNSYKGRLLILDDTSAYFQTHDIIGFKSVSEDRWGTSLHVPTVYLTNQRYGLTHHDIAFLDIILSQSSEAFTTGNSISDRIFCEALDTHE